MRKTRKSAGIIFSILTLLCFITLSNIQVHASTGDFNVESSNGEYSYAEGVLTLKKAGDYKISMKNSVTTTADRIVVDAQNINLTLAGVNIDFASSSVKEAAAIKINQKDVRIILADNSKNVLKGTKFQPGIANGLKRLTISCAKEDHKGHTCAATCGSLEVYGGDYAAGIGSGSHGTGAYITITGGNIKAIGGINGAGIGGGLAGTGRDIAITGGIVDAQGGLQAAGIGGHVTFADNITISGGHVTAKGGAADGPENVDGARKGAAIGSTICYKTEKGWYEGWECSDVKIVPPAKSYAQTRTSSTGTDHVYYQKETIISKTVGVQSYFEIEIVKPDLYVEGGTLNVDYKYVSDHIEFIKRNGEYVVSMQDNLKSTKMYIMAKAKGVVLTLDGVNIDVSSIDGCSPISVVNGNDLKLILKDKTRNELIAGNDAAGIQVDIYKSSLEICCEHAYEEKHACDYNCGEVESTGGKNGAGIGGNNGYAGRYITISGGQVEAGGGEDAAGIGGGKGGIASNIVICGGSIYAKGGSTQAHAIGSGYDGPYMSENAVTIQPIRCSAIDYSVDQYRKYYTLCDENTDITDAVREKQYFQSNSIYYNFKVAGGILGTDYKYESGELVIEKTGNYTISMADGVKETTYMIRISSKDTTVTLNGVNINGGSISTDENTTLILADNSVNIVKENSGAGISNYYDPLIITCEHADEPSHGCDSTCGSLYAQGGFGGAGIGGGYEEGGSNITIKGGNIEAYGADNSAGAGIGGGLNSGASDIVIIGGNIKAVGGVENSSDGIGGTLSCTSHDLKVAPAAGTIVTIKEKEPDTVVLGVYENETDITDILKGKQYIHISTHGHKYDTYTFDASNHTLTCSCGLKKESSPHKYNAGLVTTEPTATKEGVKTFTCTVCNQKKTEVIPATGVPGGTNPEDTTTPGGSTEPALTPSEQVAKDKLGLTSQGTKDLFSFAEENDIPTDVLYVTEKTITTQKLEDVKAAAYSLLQAKATKATKNKITLKWKKVTGADGYIIFGNKCGTKNKYKRITELSKKKSSYISKKINGKKLAKGTFYKYTIIAYKLVDGKKVTIAVSKTIHEITSGGKFGNAKSVKLKNVKKNKVTIKLKKSFTVKASEVKKDKKLKSHRKLAYESSNKAVATVKKNGKITAKKKGSCYVFVYAQNGMFSKIKVTVK